MIEINNFDSIQISIASPEKIREWSHGEVTKPETINYRTQKPERDGLFCEKIFGPTKDYECHCGKYKRIRYKGIICDKCGVEVTKSKVRRERMGHIELAAPVSHIWYFRGVPSRISTILNMSPKSVEQVIYFAAFVVIDPGKTNFFKKQVIKDDEYRAAIEEFGADSFVAGMGAESLKILLREIDLDKESEELKEELAKCQGMKKVKIAKRLEIVEAFRKSGNRPEWMVMDVLPVIPPELRPMVQLDGGRFATSDLNDLYRRVINRNNRLKKMMESGAPDIVVRNEKRMLQEAVDALIDNGRHGKPVTGAGNRNLKSLSDMLRGKQGRFRQNLLGKRVDYSGRSVIVVGPELKLYQCGLPKEMALELFKPFVFRKLVDKEICHNIKSAKRAVERMKPVVWDILEEVIKDHPVLLNRAPTLHRLGIQAFEPVLVEGRAIKLHPLACTAFNADFDGDQMAVHVPLSIEAQAEARILMLSTNNILKLSDGKPVVVPTQDMILGAYYLTLEKPGALGEGRYFKDPDEAKMAYQIKEIELQAKINVRMTKEINGLVYRKIVPCTVGKIIFNEAIPQDLGFVERNTPDDMMKLEIDFIVKKKQLSQIVERCFKLKGATEVSKVLDKVKALGYKYSTISAITTSVFDMKIPGDKKEILSDAENQVLKIEKNFNRGLITDEERYNEVVEVWKNTTDAVEKDLEKNFKEFDKMNPIWMMADSGARGSMQQIKQLSGMRGLMNDPTGKVIEIPVKSSFREGLSVLEYFISSHGARKGGADTALKTADSGYLTRRLVDVSQDVIVNEVDCGDKKGVLVRNLYDASGRLVEEIGERITGRFTVNDVVNPATGEVIVPADTMISEEKAKEIQDAGIEELNIRSILGCKCKVGVCAKCYGANMASNNPVKVGEAVGIIAAQSIGEPGTQLTMRTFHTGGVASSADITQGLPRVVELVEARKPKGEATIADVKGKITVTEEGVNRTVHLDGADEIKFDYKIPFGAKLLVKNGQNIEAGDPLFVGSVNPQDILRTKGVNGVQEMMIREIQSAYRTNGVHINDKHIEVIVRQMLRKVRISNPNDTDLLLNELVDISRLEEANEKALDNGGMPATATRVLLGISKAALATESFLSAASFQETARVLTDAAIKGKVDKLVGLKENVIIGKLIPAGTGMKQYRNVTLINHEEDTKQMSEDKFDEVDYSDDEE
ncbi:MAG: DNA-directed RNA polymerase subunit beta' [Clostridiales bacterium]|jgi:DNA-directed RNA polymerase subunit beta'|nr:DNA-directed RNA polymerase subunit beta' [Clostridiales bacterium]MDY4655211.1 DNA-directed RNA polymerase subunit beta' [Eubacteriales bacterium]